MEKAPDALYFPQENNNPEDKIKGELKKREIYSEVKTVINENEKLKTAIEEYRQKCDEHTIKHIFGDANKSVILSDYLGLDEEHQKYFIQAALLHDIGKTEEKIRELVKSDKRFNKEEEDIVHGHVRKSIEYAQEIGMPDEVLQIIGAHHEENNGKSYPRKEERRQENLEYEGEEKRSGIDRRTEPSEEVKKIIHVFSIIDRFDALFNNRSYKEGYGLEKACDRLKEEFNSPEDIKVIELLLEEREKKLFEQKRDLPN